MAWARNCVLDVLCGIYKKNGLSGLSPDYSLSQAWPDFWPGMADVCYCHEFNDMLNMLNYVIKMEIIICIGLYD